MEAAWITDLSWQLPFRRLQVLVAEYSPKAYLIYTVTADSSQKEVCAYQGMKILFHKSFQGLCLFLNWPQAKHQAFLMVSQIGNGYVTVENMNTFIQKGIHA